MFFDFGLTRAARRWQRSSQSDNDSPPLAERQEPLFGHRIRVTRQVVVSDPPVGAEGQVLTEKEHGITQHPGWAELTTDFPGIRGYHYLVRMVGESEPRTLIRGMFARI